MKTATASEFQKNFGVFKDIAQREPTVISNWWKSVVLISMAEYAEYVKFKKSKYAYGGEVTEAFKVKVAVRMKKHSTTLEHLAK
jgi:hypothetical protein